MGKGVVCFVAVAIVLFSGGLSRARSRDIRRALTTGGMTLAACLPRMTLVSFAH